MLTPEELKALAEKKEAEEKSAKDLAQSQLQQQLDNLTKQLEQQKVDTKQQMDNKKKNKDDPCTEKLRLRKQQHHFCHPCSQQAWRTHDLHQLHPRRPSAQAPSTPVTLDDQPVRSEQGFGARGRGTQALC